MNLTTLIHTIKQLQLTMKWTYHQIQIYYRGHQSLILRTPDFGLQSISVDTYRLYTSRDRVLHHGNPRNSTPVRFLVPQSGADSLHKTFYSLQQLMMMIQSKLLGEGSGKCRNRRYSNRGKKGLHRKYNGLKIVLVRVHSSMTIYVEYMGRLSC